MISGKEQPVDIEDLRTNCIYNKYTEQDETIQIFWAVLESFTPEQRRDFLRFVTSTSNVRARASLHCQVVRFLSLFVSVVYVGLCAPRVCIPPFPVPIDRKIM